ncbi:SART-1 protein [Fimicolochytrium jonesii]|uniref:SART-1 protein n=1 Tax=Fimicolochytrium jonesii TaxID=1396493 RepID=UPI0022FE8A81|nr:SART-1 protein [Fimicolochytrium jonesii]KAI8823082.1 SART-1 protein [Fimicolochytrium jonesii]
MARDDGDTGDVELSIEETNALRVKLGLKPLAESRTSESQQAAEQNYAKHQKELAEKAARKGLIETIAKEKEKAKRNVKLEGATLGAASDDEDAAGDSLKWVLRQREKEEKRKAKAKKKAEMLAQKRESDLAEMDRSAVSDYKASDLKGLRVDHDLEDVAVGGETILTLKDSTILENEEEGDILHNVNIADDTKGRKNVENKKKGKKAYNVYDDEEFLDPGKKRNLLSQYDEEIDGEPERGFVISENGMVDVETRKKEVGEKLRAGAIALTYEKNLEIKDYYTQEEMVAFKKPKKKKKSSRRERRAVDEEGDAVEGGNAPRANGDDAMEVDLPTAGDNGDAGSASRPIDYSFSNRNTDIDAVNFVDDDDLQSALARSRRLQMKKRSKHDVEAIADAARQIKEEDAPIEGGMVLSATSEFVRNLATAPAPVVKAPEPIRPTPAVKQEAKTHENDVDQMDVDEADQGDEKGGWEMDDGSKTEVTIKKEKDEESDDGELMPAPLEEEPLVGAGLAATISLLTQKGFVEKTTPEELERQRKQAEKLLFLNEQRKADRLRELQREKEKQRNRERNNQEKGKNNNHRDDDDWYREEQEAIEARNAERRRAREIEERYKLYNPDVDLKYHDEYGRELNQKEAFRQLSHKFHGKKSGKMKTEKRLRKIEEELKMEKMSSTDTPLGTAAALSERTRAAGAAHLVLSVGNRSALPADIPLASAKRPKPAKPATKQPKVTTTTVIDTERNVNTFNREKVAFGLGGSGAAQQGGSAPSSGPSAAGQGQGAKRKGSEADGGDAEGPVAKKAREDR